VSANVVVVVFVEWGSRQPCFNKTKDNNMNKTQMRKLFSSNVVADDIGIFVKGSISNCGSCPRHRMGQLFTLFQ